MSDHSMNTSFMPQAMEPDVLMVNGIVRTLVPGQEPAQGLAVGSGRILAVGSTADIRALAGKRTRIIDLEGRSLMPGFVDAHFHMYQWTMGRTRLELDRAKSFKDAMAMVRQAAQKAGPGEWILGQGFNESDWPENRMPLMADLDQAAPDNPVIIWRCDLHLAVANGRAMELAGVDANSEAPEGGEIGHGHGGGLNGVLREAAINLVKDSVPLPDPDTFLAAMCDAQQALHRLGIVGLGDVRMDGASREAALTLQGWQSMNLDRSLALRVFTGIPGEDLDQAVSLGIMSGLGDEYLRIGHVKYFYDGGMGARTALMCDPYLDTGRRGMRVLDPGRLERDLRLAHASGLAVMVHAIGDGAVRQVLDVFDTVFKGAKPDQGPVYPHRLEHCQVARPEDVARLARMGLPVCMQPTNMVLDINMIEQCAPDIGKYAYGFRSMLDAGVEVMFSSDCPVCDPNPLLGIQAAVTRQRADGTPEDGWHPELRVSVGEAVAGYTTTPARHYGLEDVWGCLAPGHRADMIVLDQDLFNVQPLAIARSRVCLTMVDGKIVFEESQA